jgi:hypothetical protein
LNVCDGQLSVEECTEAIFKMKLNKSPGIDGLTVEFYRTFWESIKYLIVFIFNSLKTSLKIIGICISKKNRQHNGQKIPNGIIIDRQSQKERQPKSQQFENTKRDNQFKRLQSQITSNFWEQVNQRV